MDTIIRLLPRWIATAAFIFASSLLWGLTSWDHKATFFSVFFAWLTLGPFCLFCIWFALRGLK